MYVVGYPKSGNSWLCWLLAYCINTRYEDVYDPALRPQQPHVRKYVDGGLPHTSFQDRLGKILKTHRLDVGTRQDAPWCYIVRDGRDVMVSMYNFTYFTRRPIRTFGLPMQSMKNLAWNMRRVLWCRFRRQKFSDFVVARGRDWADHVRAAMEHRPNAVVRYEDLRTNPDETLDELLKKMGVEVDPRVIRAAVETFDFRRITNRKPGQEDAKSFFRKGVVGDWKEWFRDEPIRSGFQEVAGDVLEQLGYADWGEPHETAGLSTRHSDIQP